MSKKITAFAAGTDADAANGNNLWAIGDPTTGLLKRVTGSQAKTTMQTFKTKHVATGSEGLTLTIAALANKEIIAIYREGSVLYEVSATPDETEFIWATPDITLGLATNPGERFLILYKTL